jgi:hypothetical protein
LKFANFIVLKYFELIRDEQGHRERRERREEREEREEEELNYAIDRDGLFNVTSMTFWALLLRMMDPTYVYSIRRRETDPQRTNESPEAFAGRMRDAVCIVTIPLYIYSSNSVTNNQLISTLYRSFFVYFVNGELNLISSVVKTLKLVEVRKNT